MDTKKFDTARSDQVIKAFRGQEGDLLRYRGEFSGTWEASMDDFFAMLCPARETDWIPDWKVQVLHSDAGGYASDKCVFRTDPDSSHGGGIWVFTGFRKNDFIEFVRFHEDMVLQVHVKAREEVDGRVTGTWRFVASALSEKGNAQVEEMREGIATQSKLLPKVVGHYLSTGTMV